MPWNRSASESIDALPSRVLGACQDCVILAAVGVPQDYFLKNPERYSYYKGDPPHS
jgi:hypothetical protein